MLKGGDGWWVESPVISFERKFGGCFRILLHQNPCSLHYRSSMELGASWWVSRVPVTSCHATPNHAMELLVCTMQSLESYGLISFPTRNLQPCYHLLSHLPSSGFARCADIDKSGCQSLAEDSRSAPRRRSPMLGLLFAHHRASRWLRGSWPQRSNGPNRNERGKERCHSGKAGMPFIRCDLKCDDSFLDVQEFGHTRS